MLLTSVPEAANEPVAVAQGASSPRMLVRDGVAVVSGPPADEDAFLALGMVVAGPGRSFGWLWVGLYHLYILDRPVSP